MSLNANALTTIARLRDFMGIGSFNATQNTVVENLINATTEYIENYIGFRVKQTEHTEVLDGRGTPTVTLKNWPVSSSASFTLQFRDSAAFEENWESFDAEDFLVDFGSGIVSLTRGTNFSSRIGGYRAIYTAGYDFDNSTTFLSATEAADLEWVAWMLGSQAYLDRTSNPKVSSESIGDYSVSFGKGLWGTDSGTGEGSQIKEILDKYKRVNVGGVVSPQNT